MIWPGIFRITYLAILRRSALAWLAVAYHGQLYITVFTRGSVSWQLCMR